MEKADAPNPLKIRSVLVAIDSSKKSVKALEFSFRLLANNREGKLYIINVVNPVLLRVSGDAPQTGIMVIEKQEEEVKLARRLVSHAVAHAKANGILNVEGIVKEADPVRAGGSVAVPAIHMDDIPLTDYESQLFHEKKLFSVEANTRADALEFMSLAGRTGIRSVVKEYRLEDANAALSELKAGKINGSAVLRII